MVIDSPPPIPVRGPAERTSGLPRRLHEDFPEPTLLFKEMSYDQFLQLPEKPKAEWLDGIAVIRLAPAFPVHSLRINWLLLALVFALPDLVVLSECSIWIGRKEFVPDIIAIAPHAYDPDRIVDPPIIAVEILSPSTRKYDLTTKADAYRAAGIRQYWTMDTAIGEIIVRENVDDHWEIIAILNIDHPEITIDVGVHGTVRLDRDELFKSPNRR